MNRRRIGRGCATVAGISRFFFEVYCWHPRFVSGSLVLPLCGAAPTFFAAAKKVGKESGLTPPARVIAHGPPTSPLFKPQCAGPSTLPAHCLSASPASIIRSSANRVGRHAPSCGKRCAGCRTAHGCARTHYNVKRRCPVRREGRHTVCRNGTGKYLEVPAATRAPEAGEASG